MKTLAEFNNEFDVKFNNAYSGSAPGIDMYEKSVFYTQAQEEIVRGLAVVYDSNEKIREILRTLTVNKSIDYNATLNTNLITIKFNSNSKLFEVPADAWYILTEHLDDDIDIKPITLDEYNVQIKNPFKKPISGSKAWRLDVADTVSTIPLNIREIIYPDAVSTYNIRYIVEPSPIILEEVVSADAIRGLTAATMCKLSSSIHEDILNKAVDLATEAFKTK